MEAGVGDVLEEGAAAVVHPDVALVDAVQRQVHHRPDHSHPHHDGRRVRRRHGVSWSGSASEIAYTCEQTDQSPSETCTTI